MTTHTEKLDTFNGWQVVANVAALVALALLPYLIYIIALMVQ